MKKFLLSLGLCALAGSAFAQDIKLGLKVGPTLSTASGKDNGNASYLVGVNGGVTANFAFTDMFSVQPELLYSMKGYKYDNTTKGKVTHHYVDIPILLRIDADGPFFEVGPQFGLLVNATQKPDASSAFERTDEYNKTDVGYVAGVGYQADNGLSLGFRYNGGITKLYKAGPVQEIRNSAFMLQLGYRFE
jgi:hypothetical protein